MIYKWVSHSNENNRDVIVLEDDLSLTMYSEYALLKEGKYTDEWRVDFEVGGSLSAKALADVVAEYLRAIEARR